ncbi:AAA family ATPase [Kytococcus sp. Marseille-QA3725]
MRIHRIEVQDLRGIDHYALEVPDSGVLVVEGPNEAGKSTLVRALDMLLTEKATSRKQYVKDAQPIGRDEAPRVTAELTVGGQRFTYTKQWLRQVRTEFRGHGPGGRQLTGDDAHKHVCALLEEHGDETLRRAMQLLQEGALTLSGLDGSRSLAAALDAASGGDTGQDVDQAASLVERVEADAAAYWTPTFRPTGELKRLQDEHAAASAREEAARAAVTEIEGDVRRAADLAAAAERAEERHRTARAEQEDLTRRWTETEAERTAEAAAREALERADREHARAEADQRARVVLVAELEEAMAAERTAQEALEEATGPHERARKALEEAGRRRKSAEDAEGAARTELREAESLVATARAGAELTALERTVERLESLVTRQREVAERLTGEVVDDEALERITAAQDALRSATARRDATSPRVRIGGDASVPVTVDGEELTGDRPWERAVTHPTRIGVSGVEVELLPPRGADDSEVQTAERELGELLRTVGAEDVAHAHRLHAAVQRAEADRVELDQQFEAAREGRTLEEWRDARQEARSRVDRAADGLPDPEEAEQRLETARAEQERQREAAEQVRAEEAAARETRDARRAAVDRAEVQRDAAVAAATRVRERVAAARELADDEAVEQALAGAVTARDEARELLARRSEALQEAGSVEEDDLEAARVAAEQAEVRRTRAREDLVRAETVLAQAGQEGRAEVLAEAEAALEHATEAVVRVQARADALKVLLETLRARRAEAQASYVRPYREALEELGSVLHGEDFAVEVAPDLTIVSRSVGGAPVPVEALSTGAREQLAVLARLAVSRVVDGEEGMPVVLDDALGWSDPERLRRMTRALQRAGADAQVILLTCFPGRYDGIAGAVVRTVEDLRTAAGA